MNKIVTTIVPASKVPTELRGSIPVTARVRVVVEEYEPDTDAMTFEQIFAARKPPFRSADDIMAEVYEGRHGD